MYFRLAFPLAIAAIGIGLLGGGVPAIIFAAEPIGENRPDDAPVDSGPLYRIESSTSDPAAAEETAPENLEDRELLISEISGVLNAHYMGNFEGDPLLDIPISDWPNYFVARDPYLVFRPPATLAVADTAAAETGRRLGLRFLSADAGILVGAYRGRAADDAGVPDAGWLKAVDGRHVTTRGELLEALWAVVDRTEVTVSVARSLHSPAENYRIIPGEDATTVLDVYRSGPFDILRLFDFSAGHTHLEIAEWIAEERDRSREIVLDLRFNSGGSLLAALSVASLFFDEGRLLGAFDREIDGRRFFYSIDRAAAIEGDVFILVGPATASSAEIFALILQDLGRATVIGTRTVGKCIVQEYFNLDEGGDLTVPIAEVLGPEGGRCHHSGINPQLVIPTGAIADTEAILARFDLLIAQ